MRSTITQFSSRRLRRAGLLVLLAAAGLPVAAAAGASTPPLPALVAPPALALASLGPVTSSACTSSGTASSCALVAHAGSMTLPLTATTTQSVPVWAYTSLASDLVTAPGGPTLVVTAGQPVTVTLTNNLTEASSLLFQGQSLVPDRVGAPAGGNTSYTFTPATPGTFLYEAGLVANGQHQGAMGLHGALVVRPALLPGQAYDSGPYAATSAFDDEAVMVLSEIDPNLNKLADPATFDMRNFAPQYGLVNGAVSPNVAPITSGAGHKVLVRYVNAGVVPHSMAVLGLHQTLVGDDGHPFAAPRVVVASTVSPGQTQDAVATVPAGAAAGSTYPVYDGSLNLHNAASAGIGGMVATITLGSGTATVPPPVTSGVVASGVTNTVDATVTALIGDTVTGAEFYVDSTAGAGTAMTASGTSVFGTQTVTVTGTISPALTVGVHTVFVHGRDVAGWGPFASVSVTVAGADSIGPIASAVTASPTPTNGTAALSIGATVSDATTGSSNVTAAEYFLDVVGAPGTGTPMAGTFNVGPTTSVTASLTAAAVGALANGPHTVFVHGQDASGNWGATVSVPFVVDKVAPSTGPVVTVTPATSNGLVNVALSAPVDDTAAGGSTITAAEYSIDSAAVANGAGTAMSVAGGATATATAVVTAATINALTPGLHTVYVHGRDAAGNWGTKASATLTLDRSGPGTTLVVVAPDPANGVVGVNSATPAERVTARVTVTGGVTVSAAEAFIDTTPPVTGGSGIAMLPADGSFNGAIENVIVDIPLPTIAALTSGSHTMYVRGRDASGVWGPAAARSFNVDKVAPTFTGVTLTPASVPQGVTTALTVAGAVDPTTAPAVASGVAGGEWWIGTTNVSPGLGTAFTGSTATVGTGSLAAGSYTVRVRIRDVAGNWSTGTNGVRTATLTVTRNAIFADTFESGTTNAWTSRSTANVARLAVTAGSGAAANPLWKLQAQGNNTNYVQFDIPAPAATTTDTRFYFDPNGNTSTGHDIFSTATTNTFTTAVYRVRYRWSGGVPQVQLQLGAANTNTVWTTIVNASMNAVEVTWTGTVATLYVGGTQVQSLSRVGAQSIASFRLGSVTNGGVATPEYFDHVTVRQPVPPTLALYGLA